MTPEYQEMQALAKELQELDMQLPYANEKDQIKEQLNNKLRERVLTLLAQDKGFAATIVEKPSKRVPKAELDRKKADRVNRLTELLEKMAQVPQPQPAKVRNYAMACKPQGVRLAWECNFKHALHSSPCGCAKPQMGDDVLVLSDEERALMAQAPFDEEQYKRDLGVRALKGEKGYSTKERTGIRPCLDVCGIWGGHTGEGTKTVLPSKAYAKISTRLVANQDFEKISKLFQEYFESVAPDYVTVKVTPCHGGAAYVSPLEMKAYKAAERAMTDTFGKRPIPTRSGGSIPIVAGFEKILGLKSILMGFGLASDDIHAPNENYPLQQFFKGIETIPLFYKYFAE